MKHLKISVVKLASSDHMLGRDSFIFLNIDLAASGLSCGMWNLSFPTRDLTPVPCIGRQILNQWTTKDVLG